MNSEYSLSVLAIALYDNRLGELFMPLVIDISNPFSFWKAPGGGVEDDEISETTIKTIIAAILREVNQETGLKNFGDVHTTGEVLDKSRQGNKHIQHCTALEVLNLEGLHTEPVRDGNELLITGIFSIKHVYESINTNSTIDTKLALNYENIAAYHNIHSKKVFIPHGNFIYKTFKKLEFIKIWK